MDTRTSDRVPDPAAEGGERPLGDLLRALARDAQLLVRQEVALAKAEVSQIVRTIARGAVLAALGGFMALMGLLVLLAAAVVGLGALMGDRYALGALIVGVVLLAAGGALAFLGARKAASASLAPEGAIASLRETGEWVRAEVRELRATLAGRRRPALASGTALRVAPGAAAARGGMPQSAGEPPPRPVRRGGKGPLPASAPLWKRVVREVSEDEVTAHAARVAFYFFLSLPPAMMALFALTGLFGGERVADWLTQQLTTALPQEASELVGGFVNEVVHQNAPGPLSIGLLVALWAGSNVFTALEDTLNDAWDVTEERSFVKKKAIAIGMLVACALLFLAGSAVLLSGGALTGALGLGGAGRTAWAVLQWPLGFALVAATFWIIYYVLPNRDQSAFRVALAKASAVSAALFVVATLAFRFYISNFGSYSQTYGLLGTVIVLLLWMYVTSLVILLGGEIASEMERGARARQ